MDLATKVILAVTALTLAGCFVLWWTVERRHAQTASRLEQLQRSADDHSADHKIIRMELGEHHEQMIERDNGLWHKIDLVLEHLRAVASALIAPWKRQPPAPRPPDDEPPRDEL